MNLLASRRGRSTLLACLYFSEGAPIGWLWWALPAQMRAAGAPLDQITGLTALLALPWGLKLLWAPLVDGLRGRRWGLRSWAVAAQLGMGAALLPLLGGVDLAAPASLAPILLVHAVLAATQDVAVDGIAVRVLAADERGLASGWMQLGMLAGRGLFGGLALTAEAWIGFDGVVRALIAACTFSALLLVLATREPESARAALAREPRLAVRLRALGVDLASMSAARSTWAGLTFALLGGAAFEAVGGTAGSLLVDLGLQPGTVGSFYALPVLGCMAGGALLGGRFADRHPRRAACRGGLLAVFGTVVLLACALLAGVRGVPLLVLLALVYLALGSFTAASYALFMDLSPGRAAATRFSAFMGASNLCEAWAVWTAGRLASWTAAATPSSHAWAWLALAGASLLALLALPHAVPRSQSPQEDAP